MWNVLKGVSCLCACFCEHTKIQKKCKKLVNISENDMWYYHYVHHTLHKTYTYSPSFDLLTKTKYFNELFVRNANAMLFKMLFFDYTFKFESKTFKETCTKYADNNPRAFTRTESHFFILFICRQKGSFIVCNVCSIPSA